MYLEPLDREGEGEEDAECQADVAGALHHHVHTYTQGKGNKQGRTNISLLSNDFYRFFIDF